MTNIPAKIAKRISEELKRFQPIIDSARARDINESDTVTIVTDILQGVLGYDKYSEITSEHAIRGTYCDLAVKIDGDLTFLVEVKAVGHELKDQFIKQAIDYASNQGVEWVALTNGHTWRVYQVSFGKPIDFELILDLDLLRINPKKEEEIAGLFLLSKEGWQKSRMEEYCSQKKAVNRFTIAAVLQDEDVLQIVRRELRRISPDAKISQEEIVAVLVNEVLKREVLEGDKAEAAKKLVAKSQKRSLRSTKDDAAPSASADSSTSTQF